MSREATNKLIEFAEEGIMSWEEIARAALCYMSEDEVRDMADANDLLCMENFDEEDEDDFPLSLEYDEGE
jgi:hypothetical protein